MHATQIFWKKQLKNSYKTPFPQERVGIFPLGNRATQTWKKPLPITNFTTSKILPTSLCAKKNNFGARLKPVKNPQKSITIHPNHSKILINPLGLNYSNLDHPYKSIKIHPTNSKILTQQPKISSIQKISSAIGKKNQN